MIWSIGLSTRDNAEIWVGTDDGVVRVTRDGGKSWTDVTPKGVPAWAKIATVEPSPTTPGTAYIAVDNHRQDDFRPWVYRTRDYGATWTLVTEGLPADHFVGVVRADTVRAGLLYAGTETGVFVSFDDGGHWQPLQRNLPVAWVRDLAVHGDDLIAATQGRAIWVLDDLSPLRQHDAVGGERAASTSSRPPPRCACARTRTATRRCRRKYPPAAIRPTGAVIDYWLARPAKRVELEIRDAAGAIVRSYSSDDAAPAAQAERYFSADWLVPAVAARHRRRHAPLRLGPALPAAARDRVRVFAQDRLWHGRARSCPQGPVVAPGEYRVVLRVDGREQSVAAHGRHGSARARGRGRAGVLRSRCRASFRRCWQSTTPARPRSSTSANARANCARSSRRTRRCSRRSTSFDKRLAPLNTGTGDHADDLNLKAIGGVLRSIATDVESTDRAPTEPQRRAIAETAARLDRALASWTRLRESELPRLNAALASAGLAGRS